jgi:protein-S-isoprenylcysteine O-methyltransferase Ste14
MHSSIPGGLAVNKFFLFLINIATGLSLAIQVLIHPTLEASARTMFLIAAVIFINWAVFTWLAYSSAMKEKRLSSESKPSAELPQDDTNQRGKSLLNVMTVVYLVVILLALISLNVLVFLEMTETSYLVWIILTAILLPLFVSWIANRRINKLGKVR